MISSMGIPDKLQIKLQNRKNNNSLRILQESLKLIDFSSNDYLGFAKSATIFDNTHDYLIANNIRCSGSTGSRLLSGNHDLFSSIEKKLASDHKAESALIFNSGYDANLGLLGSVPQRNDLVLYDKLAHASIRDGIKLSHAKSIAFEHNDLLHLENKLIKSTKSNFEREIYIVTESVFSMDGDSPNLSGMVNLCRKYKAKLIIDEAHAVGVFGLGKMQELGLHHSVFARIVTFGKALGCHGAVILGSKDLTDYLINFARSFIYTTALSPHSLVTVSMAYDALLQLPNKRLQYNIKYFKKKCEDLRIAYFFIDSQSAIQSCVISENKRVKFIATKLQESNFDVKAILSPTVAKGQERLRFCLHSFNREDEIRGALNLLSGLLKNAI